jgi:hypothetical protein
MKNMEKTIDTVEKVDDDFSLVFKQLEQLANLEPIEPTSSHKKKIAQDTVVVTVCGQCA